MSCIVIVDDQKSSRQVISELAATLETNVSVKAFANPFEALSYVHEHTPDLLIADYRMLDINGAELIRRFREVPKCSEVPAVVVAPHENLEFRYRACEAGTSEFLVSPVDPHEFRVRSRNLLALRRSRRNVACLYELPGEASDHEGAVEQDKAADDQIETLNGLLETVSARLLVKYKELDRANGDLQNLIAVTGIAAIFVDENLLVRHFTPEALGVYVVSSQNIGQSLLDVICTLDYCDLESDFQRVTGNGATVRRYLEQHDGTAWYLMRILPNWCRDGSFSGATLTFLNVNARSRGRA
ncbi:MAG: diguanylate cyclase [Rhodospirillales bacterium]|nr:diguanylate cyclase [Rhodospirillales bacterium]